MNTRTVFPVAMEPARAPKKVTLLFMVNSKIALGVLGRLTRIRSILMRSWARLR